MRPYVEYILENDGVCVLDNVAFDPEAMETHARDAFANGVVQVSFVNKNGKETIFERKDA